MDPKPPKKPGGRKYWWAGGIVCLLVVAALAAGWIYVSGYQVWTDGRDIVSPVSTAKVRQVLWSKPESMAAEFNTPGDEYEICLSSDSNELYFVRGRPGQGADIFTSRRTHNKWSKPVRLDAVNSKHDELGPRLSADGRLLLFYSNRPGGIGGYDVWVSQRTGGVWGRPVNLGPNVNSKHNEYGPSITADNRRLYFATNRKAAERMGKKIQWRATIRQGQLGDYDLFSAEVDFSPGPLPTTATSRPAAAPGPRLKILADQALELPGVNTLHNEGTPCVSPWGDFLYFASNRPGGQGGFDLYRARITEGRCDRLENLGPEINTAGNETDPQLTRGGFMLYFSSDRDGGEEGTYDLYTSESHEVYAQRVGRGLPTLGWSVWVLLASLALLIPLMLFLRAGGYKHLSMLQKCFVVALLLHLFLTLMLSLAQMSQEIYQYVVDEPDEVELDLSVDKQLEVRTQIRHQLADLAPAAPSETQIARLDTEFQPVQEVKRLDTNVPEVRKGPVEQVFEMERPQNEPEIKPEQVATPTPTVHMSDLAIKLTPPEVKIRSKEAKPKTATAPPSANQARQPSARIEIVRPDATRLPTETTKSVSEMPAHAADVARPVGDAQKQENTSPPTVHMSDLAIKLTPPEVKIRSEEAKPKIATAPPGANQVRQPAAIVKTARPDATRLPTETTKSVPDMAAHIADVARPLGDAQKREYTPTPKLTEMNIALAAPKVSSNPIKEAPAPGATTVNVAEPTGAKRRKAAASAAKAGSARIKTPTVQADTDSLLARSGPTRAERPVGDAVARANVPTPKVIDIAMNLSGLKIKPSRIKAAKEPAGAASVNKPAGSSRAAASKPTSTAGTAKLAVPSVEPSGKSLAMTGSTAQIARPLGKVAPRAALTAPVIADVAINPSSPKIKASTRQTEAAPASSATASLESVRTGPIRATAPASKAGWTRLSAPTARLSQHSLTSAITVAHQVAKANEVSVSVNVPLPNNAPKVGPPAPPVSAAVVRDEAAVGQVAKEVTTTGVGKITAVPKVPSGRPETLLTNLSAPTARGSQHSLASVLTVTHQLAKVGKVHVSATVPLPSNAPKVDLPAPPVNVAAASGEAAVGQVATEVTTTGIGKITIADKPPSGSPQAMSAETRDHKPSTVSVVKNVVADTPGRTAYRPKALLARPLVAIGPLGGKLGPPQSAKPEVMFHRKFEQRQRLLKDMGGTKASEAAVARALVYLSRIQEKDGAWGTVTGKSRRHRRQDTDVALTGLSALCFLAGDHTPSKDGPYRETVTKAVDFLIEQQRKDGSMWTRGGRMYGHAIATLALSEAAIMTNDPKYRKAAIKGAQFIVKAQTRSHGGWRYEPRKDGDTSVLGWCVMALYSAQRMGMEIPPETFKGASRWLDRVSCGRTKFLFGYTSGSPKPAMAAEGAFSRMLLGQTPSPAQQKELANYLNANRKATANNFYLAYYASLAMMQIGGDAWRKWNPQMRERLVALQTRGGSADGAWTTNTTYKRNAGTVYTTSMATLTLEVYYRYLPMLGEANDGSPDPGVKPDASRGTESRRKKRR